VTCGVLVRRGTLLLLSSYVVRSAIMNTTAWMHFAVWATRFV
jgi:hypothetical protein